MRKLSWQYKNILLLVVICACCILIPGCNGKVGQPNTEKGASVVQEYDGVAIEIIQPSVNLLENEKSVGGFVLQSADLEYLKNELLANGATKVTIMTKKGEEYIELNSPADFSVMETGNYAKIIATGNYDELKQYTENTEYILQEESTHLAILRELCNTFEINVTPYSEAQN